MSSTRFAGSRRAVLLDRDGVVIVNRDDYVKDIAEVEFIPGSLEAARVLAGLGFGLAVVSNQSAVGRGIIDRPAADAIQDFVLGHLSRAAGATVTGWLCPHAPSACCSCRKPGTQLLSRALGVLAAAPEDSYMVGDAMTDLVAGDRLGLRPVLVRTGRERRTREALRMGALVFGSLADFAGSLTDMSRSADGGKVFPWPRRMRETRSFRSRP